MSTVPQRVTTLVVESRETTPINSNSNKSSTMSGRGPGPTIPVNEDDQADVDVNDEEMDKKVLHDVFCTGLEQMLNLFRQQSMNHLQITREEIKTSVTEGPASRNRETPPTETSIKVSLMISLSSVDEVKDEEVDSEALRKAYNTAWVQILKWFKRQKTNRNELQITQTESKASVTEGPPTRNRETSPTETKVKVSLLISLSSSGANTTTSTRFYSSVLQEQGVEVSQTRFRLPKSRKHDKKALKKRSHSVASLED
jgi:hypothetical protein